MSDTVYYRPLIPLVLALAAGIFLGDRLPGFGIFAIFVILSALMLVVKRIRQRQPSAFPPLFALVAIGYLAIQHWTNPQLPVNHIHHFADNRDHLIVGTLLTDPAFLPGRCEAVAAVTALGTDAVPVCGRIRLAGYESPDVLCRCYPGDRIRFKAKLKPVRSSCNPGGFDYERFMGLKGIKTAAYLRKETLEILPNGSDHLLRPVHRIRHAIRETVRQIDPGIAGDLFRALIIGEGKAVTREIRDRFASVGIAHLLAISGLHIGGVAAAVFYVACSLLAFSRRILWSGMTRRIAAIVTLAPVLIYGLLAGMSPSTQRAVIMVIVVLAAEWMPRRADPLNTVFVAGGIILILHPPSIFSVSFQLSFAAVFFIIAGLPLLQQVHLSGNRLWQWIVNYVRLSIIVSILAVLGTAPIVLTYFYRVSMLSIVTNLVMIPLIGWIVIPVGLMAALLRPVHTATAEWLIRCALSLLDIILHYILPAFEQIPFGDIHLPPPTLPEILAYYLCLGFFINKAVASRQPQKTAAPKHKISAALVIGLAMVFILGDAAYWMHRRFYHTDLRITVIDVGQGSSTLIEFPGGRTMLIDGGGFFDNAFFDVGRNVVAPLLWRKRIMTIDILAISHKHADHVNGLVYVVRHFRIGRIDDNGVPSESRSFRELTAIADKRNIPLPPLGALPRQWRVADVSVERLHPDTDISLQDAASDRNNASLVYRIATPRFSILIPGDIEAETEARLVKSAAEKLKSTVLIAAHHGSGTSNTLPFLKAVSPTVVIASCGYRNRFKVPHPEVVERFSSLGASFFRTDRDGAVTISVNRDNVQIMTCRENQNRIGSFHSEQF